MKTVSPSARLYRWLGCLALLHAAGIFGAGYFVLSASGDDNNWVQPLWVGVVTLWFFWPIILALHAGRSWRLFVLFVLLGAIILFPSWRFYNFIAPRFFGLPDFVSMTPWSIWQYYSAYVAGRADAKKDMLCGVLAIEESGFGAGGGPEVYRIFRDRFGIEIRVVAGCVVNERIIGHEDGYNSNSEPTIDQRFGHQRLEAAREEGYKLQREQQARYEQSLQDLTKRLTTLPAGAKVTTKLITPWLNSEALDNNTTPPEVAGFIQLIEKTVAEAVPENAPAFELHVSTRLDGQSTPSFEMSGSLYSPESTWEKILDALNALPAQQWNKGFLSVYFDFQIQSAK